MTNGTNWQISGDYFENCNCDVLCPCLVSTAAPLTSKPSQGVCDVALAIHIDQGRYGEVSLDGLNAVVAVHTPGPMANGNWTIAAYVDERADDQQTEAIGAILSGSVGGPMAMFAPLISNNLGAKKVPIAYAIEGKTRSAKIAGVMHMSVKPLPTIAPGGEIWAATGHPFNPEKLALAVGEPGSTFADHGMRWDNSGKNGHYAAIRWSNA